MFASELIFVQNPKSVLLEIFRTLFWLKSVTSWDAVSDMRHGTRKYFMSKCVKIWKPSFIQTKLSWSQEHIYVIVKSRFCAWIKKNHTSMTTLKMYVLNLTADLHVPVSRVVTGKLVAHHVLLDKPDTAYLFVYFIISSVLHFWIPIVKCLVHISNTLSWKLNWKRTCKKNVKCIGDLPQVLGLMAHRSTAAY